MKQPFAGPTAATRSFWRDLNVFIAAFVLFAGMGGFLLFIPASLLAKLVLPARQAELLAIPLGYALAALALAWWWWKHGLSPVTRNPLREVRFRRGHLVLAIANIAMFAMFGLTFLAPSLVPRMPSAAGLVMGLASLAPMAGIAGLIMVLSARGAPPAFADTLPLAHAGPGPAKPAIAPPAASILPSAGAVVAGLIASSLILFVATVFASLSFQYNTERFTGVVLPIAVALYVLYLATTLWLLGNRRAGAIALAWAPTVLLTVGLPVLQVVLWLVGTALGR